MADGTVTGPDRRRRQEARLSAVASVAFILLGMGTAVVSLWQGIHYTDHWRALRTSGTPVTATVAERRLYSSKSHRDRIRLVYDYDGRHVDTWTRCPGPRGCNPPPGPQVTVWIDPANPADFVQDAEDTSRWVGIRVRGLFAPFGVAIAAIGAVGVLAGVPRRPVPVGQAPPPRREGRRLGRRPGRRPRRRR